MQFFLSKIKTLCLIAGLVLFSVHSAYAAPIFNVTTKDATINATVSDVSSADTVVLYYKTSPFDQQTVGTATKVGLSVFNNSTVYFSVPATSTTKYYVLATGKISNQDYVSPLLEVTTGSEVNADKLTYEAPSSECKAIYINGKVNSINRSEFEITLEWRSRDARNKGEAPRISSPTNGRGAAEKPGIAVDGTYSFHLTDLVTGTKYYVTQIIKTKSGEVYREEGDFDSCKGHIAAGTTAAADDYNKRSYRFLSDSTGKSILPDNDLCLEEAGADQAKIDDCNNQVGNLINFIIKVLIGISAVILVLQIIIKGYQYMTSDIPKLKVNLKERILEAFGGLLLALSSYLILNTINPRLVIGDLTIGNIDLSVTNFEISGAGSYDGKAVKINFNKEAYPAALLASQKTGVDVALILAVFGQETGSGRNVGRCLITDAKANMYEEDKTALKTIVQELGKDINKTPVSCAAISNGTFDGHGGAIGYTQFRPVTWLAERVEAKTYLGKTPDPWSLDAIMVEAVYLKKLGALSNQKEAACKYFSGPGGYCAKKQSIENYGASVMAKKASLQKQIAEAKAKGEIK